MAYEFQQYTLLLYQSMFASTVLLSSHSKDLENQFVTSVCWYEQFLQHRQYHQFNYHLLYVWITLYIWPQIICVSVHHNSLSELHITHKPLKSYISPPIKIASILTPGPPIITLWQPRLQNTQQFKCTVKL